VPGEIESSRTALSQKLDFFGERTGEALGLLANDQEALFKTLPIYLDVIAMQAKEVLGELEKADLIKNWKTRRCGYWGTLRDLQAKVADRVFPKVEIVLNELRNHLEVFMGQAERRLAQLQIELSVLEAEHKLSGLEPIALATAQSPLFEDLRRTFKALGEQERDGIVLRLDDFVTQEVQERLDLARSRVANVFGRGTTVKQVHEVSRFYDEVRKLLADSLRVHMDCRIREFAGAIQKNAESVGPRIREASEGVVRQRLDAIESSLEIAAEGQKEQVAAYLSGMIALFKDFAASPEAVSARPRIHQIPNGVIASTSEAGGASHGGEEFPALQEQHYEIPENASGSPTNVSFSPTSTGRRPL